MPDTIIVSRMVSDIGDCIKNSIGHRSRRDGKVNMLIKGEREKKWKKVRERER